MPADYKALQERRHQYQALQTAENSFDLAEERRPAAGALVEPCLLRQLMPVHAGAGVVLDVVAVIEEQQVVEVAVMAGGAAGVLVAALEPAEAEAQEIAGDVGGEEKLWRGA